MGIFPGLILKPVVAANILRTNLLSYYNFDESSGNLLDIDGSVDFDLIGPPTQGATGKINDAYSFDGSDYCTSISSVPWDLTTTDYSVSFWFNQSSITFNGNRSIFDYRDANNDGLFIYSDNGKIFTSHNLADKKALTAHTKDVWNHYLLTSNRSGGLGTIYINGVSIGPLDVSTDLNLSTNRPKIGSRSFAGPTNFWVGLIDEMGIWNRALTSDEVALLYNSGNGLSYTNFG